MRRVSVVVALVLLATVSCEPASVRRPVTREPVFQDDFSSGKNSWGPVEPKAGAAVVQEGSLVLVPDRTFQDGPLVVVAGSERDRPMKDVTVEAEITFRAEANNQNAGVVCRGVGYDRRYAFTIDPTGSYEIGLRDKQVSRGLAFGHHPAVAPNAKNKVRGECHGDVLSMFVNDQLITRVSDQTLTNEGFAGLRSSWINPDAEVTGAHVDNFSVSRVSGTPARPSSERKIAATGQVALRDDFATVNPGWLGDQGQRAEENVTLKYTEGRMEITVSGDRGANIDTGSVTDTAGAPLAGLEDVSIEADIVLNAGSPRATAGFQCRRADPLRQEYYVGLIYPSRGEFAVIRWELSEAGQPRPVFIRGGYSSRIKTAAGAVNRVRLECVGKSISLVANGYKIATATDTAYKSGDLAMLAESSEGQPTTVFFDNLLIRRARGPKTPSPGVTVTSRSVAPSE